MVSATAPTEVTHKVLARRRFLAHRFHDGTWYIGTYKHSCVGKKQGLRAVYYLDDKHVWLHELALKDYGIHGVWVFVRKSAKARRSLNDDDLMDEEEESDGE